VFIRYRPARRMACSAETFCFEALDLRCFNG
jgi:hypothetical protein